MNSRVQSQRIGRLIIHRPTCRSELQEGRTRRAIRMKPKFAACSALARPLEAPGWSPRSSQRCNRPSRRSLQSPQRRTSGRIAPPLSSLPQQGAGGALPRRLRTASPLTRQERRKLGPVGQRRRHLPKRGAGGAAPAGGTASPPVPKNVGGRSRWDSGARQTRPSAEGGRKPKQAPSVQGMPPPHLQNAERVCYSIPIQPAAYMWTGGIHSETPWAGGSGNVPQARIHPRKVGTRAHAVVWHRLPGAVPLRDGCATDARRMRDG